MKITKKMITDYQQEIVELAREMLGDIADEFIQEFDELAPHFNFDNPDHEQFYGKTI